LQLHKAVEDIFCVAQHVFCPKNYATTEDVPFADTNNYVRMNLGVPATQDIVAF